MDPIERLFQSRFAQAGSLARIVQAALRAADPASAVRRYLYLQGNHLVIEEQVYDLDAYRQVYITGAGKAGAPMASAVASILGDRLNGGLLIVKEGHHHLPGVEIPPGVEILEASHPLPDERGVRATNRLITCLEACQERDLVICLLSGGGSALLTAPVPGISLDDLRRLTALLLECGATIQEINTLRKHLDRVKGGGLARLVWPATLVCLILSDVVGSPLDVIASGPCVPDPTTFADAYRVLETHNLLARTPPSILDFLTRACRGEIPDTPKPGDPIFAGVRNFIIGSNQGAAEAAMNEARQAGFNALLLTTSLVGEASQAGRRLAAVLRQVATTGEPVGRPACLIVGGETTVTLHGDGLGGRNQEIALAAVEGLAGLSEIAFLTLATDGGDGPTDAAGALVTGDTLDRARKLGMAPADYLARNDSYPFFESLGDLLITGPTGTNVNDLAFLFAL